MQEIKMEVGCLRKFHFFGGNWEDSKYPVVKQEVHTQGVMLVISINSNDNINNTIQCILISM